MVRNRRWFIKFSVLLSLLSSKKEGSDLKHFEKKLKRKIELHFKENFTMHPTALKNNIINGIVLYGFLEGYHDT